MTKRILKLAAALAVTVAGLPAQPGLPGGSPFQQAGQMGQPRPDAPVLMPAAGGRGVGGQVVVGKPFAATEERKTTQTLADGTQLENSDTNLFYRDSQGRTRSEQTVQGRTRITIMDPVEHTSVILDPAAKTARKLNAVIAVAGTRAGMQPAGTVRALVESQAVGGSQAGGGIQPNVLPAPTGAVMRGGGGGRGGAGPIATYSPAYGEAVAGNRAVVSQDPPPTSEELGVQTVNGVAAQGIRNTQIIPAGKIGNNRDIHVVNERWYSQDLQMLVKSVNSDPRFGVTTYQLTNISQNVPDAGLFQIPGDYTVLEPGR